MNEQDDLNRLFAEARETPPPARAGFMEDLVAAARAESMQPASRPTMRLSPWGVMQNALGGLPGLAGLTTAAAFGLMLGVLPSLAPSLASDLLGSGEAWLVDPLPGLDSQLELALSES